MEQSRLEQLALHCIPGIGSVTVRQLLNHFGTAENVWSASKRKILTVRGVGQIAYWLLQKPSEHFQRAQEIALQLDKHSIQAIFHSDPAFPVRLRHIPDAPSLLYYRGTADLNQSPCISLVGTRRSTRYGHEVTNKLILEIKKYNPIIISGLAYGIDIEAHRFSMRKGLATVGVIAGGHDKIYPPEHSKDVAQMIAHGGILSEHPPGVKPQAYRFPARNRIIAGLAEGVIVVEAAKKGGALITARLAQEYNREVMAVPGPYRAISSAGCHDLIKQHRAHLITSGKDIADILGWENPMEKSEAEPTQVELSVTERRILSILKEQESGLHIDHLCWSTNLTIHESALALVNLECLNLVKSLPGHRYALKNTGR